MELRQREGTQAHGRRSVTVKLPVDDIWIEEEGQSYRLAMCGHGKGKPLVLFEVMSESQIAQAKLLLDKRDGEPYPNRGVSGAPMPIVEDEDE